MSRFKELFCGIKMRLRNGATQLRRGRADHLSRAARFERLEGRSMLAIVLPLGGDMSGASITLTADSIHESNNLTIVLNDTTNLGFVTATVTADLLSETYFNFSSISFSGTPDTDGSIANNVSVTTPYQVDVVGFGAVGAGTPLSTSNWEVDAIFTASPSSLDSQFLSFFNADSLSVTAGTLGGDAASTIAGEFQSPTDLDTPNATGAAITLVDSGIGLGIGLNVNANRAVQAYSLRLESRQGGIAIDANVTTVADLEIVGKSAGLSLGDQTGSDLRTVSSEDGYINVSTSGGPISIRGVGFRSLKGGISITTPLTLTVADGVAVGTTSSFIAPAPFSDGTDTGLVLLSGGLSLTLPQTLPVTASRLELVTQSPTLIALSQLSVGSLKAELIGSLEVTNAVPLLISDFTSSPTVEIIAQNVTIQSPLGMRVVDGIKAAGNLVLSTYLAGVTTNPPTTPVDFVVTGTGDNAQASDPFAGTLRDMIEYANANALLPATATIQPIRVLFDEAGSDIAATGVVTLDASLPAIRKSLTLNGLLPDGTKVGIDGQSIVNSGLAIGAGTSGSTILNVALYSFAGSAIVLQSADNVIAGVILGSDRTKTASFPNGIGIEISGVAALRNVVGVKTVGVDAGNYIVNNTVAGVLVRGQANFTGVYGNEISQNIDGIQVINSIGTMIGGTLDDLRNTISSNTTNGIRLTRVNAVSPAYGTRVINNTISDNSTNGVLIEGGRANLVGGAGVAEGNTISGNGVGVQMHSSGTARTQRNQIVGNTISDSSVGGVLIDEGYANLVQGNTVTDTDSTDNSQSQWGIRLFRATQSFGIGPNRVYQNTVSGSGSDALNGGIVVENSIGQVIGGPSTLGNSVISNHGSGIVIVGGTGVQAARSNLIEGNFVGTNAAMIAGLGNDFDGIRIQGSLENVIRGNTIGFHSTVENNSAGISVHDAIAGNAALGNTIVLNTVANNVVGIRVSGGAHTAIGSRVGGLGNWVFSNLSDGILVNRSVATGNATATVIRGNRVGVGTGTQQAGNQGYGIHLVSTVGTTVDQGNLVAFNILGGIRMEGGRNVVIGSTMAGLGNVVRDNGVVGSSSGDGISLVQPASPGRTEAVLIAGNTVRDNVGNGISVSDSISASAETARVWGITIGRGVSVNRPDASANTIVGNGFAGVQVDGAQAVSIIGNAITANVGPKQIELLNNANAVLAPTIAGVVRPSLTAATPRVVGQASPQYDVRGTVSRSGTGNTAQTVLVDIYGTNAATSEQFFLGRVTVTIRAGAENANFRVIVGRAGRRFDQIVATTTFGTGTSEFSDVIRV